MKIKDVSDFLDGWAPPGTAEDYDNTGLITGNFLTGVQRILVSLDATEAVIQEAADRNCQLLVSHHPILFRALKKFTGQHYAARAVEMAIKKNVALFALHTNLDNADTGVNRMLAEKIGLLPESLKILRPFQGRLIKLSYFVPKENHEEVLRAVHAAGGGQIGKYYDCSFSVEGRGRFTPGEGCDPAIGAIGIPSEVEEYKVDVIVPDVEFPKMLAKLRAAHPYEELAYFASSVMNEWPDKGAGMYGLLPESVPFSTLVEMVKKQLGLKMLRHTRQVKEQVQKIALCGGSGFFLLPDAKAAGADVFLTADVKYHEFFDAEEQLVLMDAGHFETEQFAMEGIVRKLSAQFPNIAVILSETKTNPVIYA
jgi:dinuclear metal center YbgI/SA1388 family protein